MISVIKKLGVLRNRIWNPKIYNYSRNFSKAIFNSYRLGLTEFDHFEEKDINDELISEMKQNILNQIYAVQKLEIEDLALKCTWVSQALREFILKNYGLNSFVTTGNLYHSKLPINYEGFSTMKRRLRDQDFAPPCRSHTWLTLENLDIVDLTLGPNMAIVKLHLGNEIVRKDYEKLLWMKTRNFDKNGLVYEPKIIGSEYFKKINLPHTIYFS